MTAEWWTLAELAPHEDGYDTEAATRLMRRIEAARQQCGATEEATRFRLVMGEGHTVMRFETSSGEVLAAFTALGDGD